MFQLTGTHFEFGGVSSRMYNLILANVDTSRNLNLIGDVTSSNIFTKKTAQNYLIGDDYENSPFSTEVEILTDDDSLLNTSIRRVIEKWLFHRPGYQPLYFDMGDDQKGDTFEKIGTERKRLYLNCRFLNPERIEGDGGIRGYKVTLETDSLLAWQDATTVTKSFTASASGKTVTVDVDTDFSGYTYPKVTFQVSNAGGNVTIVNNTDDSYTRQTTFEGLTGNTQIVMDGRFNFITDGQYDKFSNKNFIRLLDGTNELSITGNVTSITIEWQNRRWL